MALGDNRFNGVGANLSTLLGQHGVTVTVTRYIDAQMTTRNIFGTPQGYTPTTFTASVLVVDEYLDDKDVEAGSKTKEKTDFYCTPGTLIEHDEVTYDGHTFKIEQITNAPMGGQIRLEIAIGTRVVV
ncbi:MAG: hypothetical protein ACYCVD_04200 [Desulfitobacteriaceae bacterium]